MQNLAFKARARQCNRCLAKPRAWRRSNAKRFLRPWRRTGGKRAETAKLLGIGLRTLQRKLKEYRDSGHWDDAN